MIARSLKLPFWLILMSLPFSFGAYAAPELPVVNFKARPSWSLAQGDNSYFLEVVAFQRGDLIGATVDKSGCVLICDKITEKLIKLDPGGDVTFAVGEVGEGPEDHRTRGEPLIWFNQQIARVDATVKPKVILYNEDGSFLQRVKLEVKGELSRLFWNGESVVAISTSYKFQKSGSVEFSTHLALLDMNGALIQQHPMNSWVMEKALSHPEEKLWYKPYVAVSDDGFTFVQQNIYNSQVDCYDGEFNLVWSIDGGWPSLPRTAREFAEVDALGVTGMTNCKVNHTIRRIVARKDGEVWIQPWNQEDPDGTAEFESFGRDGVRLGTVRISDLPTESGNWILRGSKLLWMGSSDKGWSTHNVSSIAVYDLVPN